MRRELLNNHDVLYNLIGQYLVKEGKDEEESGALEAAFADVYSLYQS